MKNINTQGFFWRLFILILCATILFLGLFYLQKIKVRVSNPESPEEVIKTYYRAMSYGEYEKAVSFYTERYKKQTQEYEIGHAALYNKKPLTLVQRMKSGRPIMTLLLAPLIDLLPCDLYEYSVSNNSNSNQIGFRVECYGVKRDYFAILEKDKNGNWKMDGPPSTGP